MENDKEELEVTLKIRNDAFDGFKERIVEKTIEVQNSKQVCGQLSQARSDREHAKDGQDRLREVLEQTKDDKEKFLSERNELDEKHAFLQERFDKLHDDYEKPKTAVAASARQIAALQDRERKARVESEERDRRMRDGGALFQPQPAPNETEEELKRKVARLEADCVQLKSLKDQYGQDILDLRNAAG